MTQGCLNIIDEFVCLLSDLLFNHKWLIKRNKLLPNLASQREFRKQPYNNFTFETQNTENVYEQNS